VDLRVLRWDKASVSYSRVRAHHTLCRLRRQRRMIPPAGDASHSVNHASPLTASPSLSNFPQTEEGEAASHTRTTEIHSPAFWRGSPPKTYAVAHVRFLVARSTYRHRHPPSGAPPAVRVSPAAWPPRWYSRP